MNNKFYCDIILYNLVFSLSFLKKKLVDTQATSQKKVLLQLKKLQITSLLATDTPTTNIYWIYWNLFWLVIINRQLDCVCVYMYVCI